MQTKFSFDKTSIIKILKGALIAGTGAFAITVLQSIGSADLESICTEQSMWLCKTWLAPLVAFVVPTLVNTIKEYIKGS